MTLNRDRQGMHTITRQRVIHLLQSADQVEYITSRRGTAGGSTKVGAAAEWTRIVRQAATLLVEQRAGTVISLRQLRSAACANRLCQQQRLARSEHRNPARKSKLAALRSSLAGALHWPRREISVNGPHLGQSGRLIGGGTPYARVSRGALSLCHGFCV
jgi:hypothetical protein